LRKGTATAGTRSPACRKPRRGGRRNGTRASKRARGRSRDPGTAPRDAAIRRKLDGETVTFEIVEQPILEGEAALRTLHELRALGAGLAVDDYGTGYPSVLRLRDLPLTKLKLDRAFAVRAEAD
jgi:EAL domain-containing protein (putative c-di-GMP-specific phosphodiesterase class I)